MASIEIWREVGTGRPLTADEAAEMPEEQTRVVEVDCYAECVCDGVPCETTVEAHGETLTEEEHERACEAAQSAWEESDEGREWQRGEQVEADRYREGSYRW